MRDHNVLNNRALLEDRVWFGDQDWPNLFLSTYLFLLARHNINKRASKSASSHLITKLGLMILEARQMSISTSQSLISCICQASNYLAKLKYQNKISMLRLHNSQINNNKCCNSVKCKKKI
jgi:hypothetical protein